MLFSGTCNLLSELYRKTKTVMQTQRLLSIEMIITVRFLQFHSLMLQHSNHIIHLWDSNYYYCYYCDCCKCFPWMRHFNDTFCIIRFRFYCCITKYPSLKVNFRDLSWSTNDKNPIEYFMAEGKKCLSIFDFIWFGSHFYRIP